MLGEENVNNSLPPAPPLPVPPVAAGGGSRKTYSRSISWAGSSPNLNTRNSKSRLRLPPISVSRPGAMEWPKAGPDDLGVWTSVTTTPSKRPKPQFEFDKECSRIMDHVFLGSDSVAKNLDVLRENGITHVLNCVGFLCPEYFKKDLVYKTLWLRDTPTEDITSILYDVFDYFEDVREEKGRIFVHCCKGVSRSTSLVIAYLMWNERSSFEEALQQVRSARRVTDPNMGFACQLLNCQKRVHNMPMSPDSALRVFRIAPYSSYDPLHLVPKLLARPNANAKALDSRGAFIVHVPSNIYVWIGKKCASSMLESAVLAASQVIRYEKATGPVLRVMEGEEPIEFCGAVFGEKEFRGVLGEKRVVDYDLDFEIFDKAAKGGVVPPLAILSNNHEMCLPARECGWQRLRRKLSNVVMTEFTYHKENFEDGYEYQSSESCSFLVKRFKKVS